MLRFLFVASILVPGVILAMRDRFIALLLYLWFAFFRPQDWIWFDITSLRLSLLLGALLVVPALFVGIWPNLTHPLSIGTVLFLLLGLLAQVNAVAEPGPPPPVTTRVASPDGIAEPPMPSVATATGTAEPAADS